jgi:hypothetical protein
VSALSPITQKSLRLTLPVSLGEFVVEFRVDTRDTPAADSCIRSPSRELTKSFMIDLLRKRFRSLVAVLMGYTGLLGAGC